MKDSNRPRPSKFAAFVLIASASLLIPSRPVVGQTQEPQKPASEVQQLKDRLQQLEQTVEQLKAQIVSMSDTEKKTGAATGEKVAAPTTKAPDMTSVAVPPVGPAGVTKPADDDKKGESSFSVYGFAMLDMGYQFKQADPNWFDTVRPVKLPAFRDQFAPNGNFFSSVRQTRFGVKSSTPTKYGELKTIFEFELFGTGVDAEVAVLVASQLGDPAFEPEPLRGDPRGVVRGDIGARERGLGEEIGILQRGLQSVGGE